MIVADVHHIVNEWIKKYSDTFFNYLYKRVPDKPAVKDILQETFIAAWKNFGSFKKEADEKTWLFAILKNKLIDYYRMQAKSITNLTDNSYFFDNEDHWTEKAGPKQWQEAAAALNKKEFYDVLEQCKSKLSPMQQLTFTMKYLDEHETNFICKVLEITPSNYWVIIHRSKLQLRQCLEKNWFLNETK
jgi:RNA polymerase sigma-70 factor (ECF subfamily)